MDCFNKCHEKGIWHTEKIILSFRFFAKIMLYPLKYYDVRNFKNGYVKDKKNGRYIFINEKGEKVNKLSF